MTTPFKKFWKYENAWVTLTPLDSGNPREGGKVTVTALNFDVRTFTFQKKNYYGIYNDEFLTYGEFAEGDPSVDENLLMEITKESSDLVKNKTTFAFVGNTLKYKHDVNGSLCDPELHHEIEETELADVLYKTWTETFFYGLGNKKM